MGDNEERQDVQLVVVTEQVAQGERHGEQICPTEVTLTEIVPTGQGETQAFPSRLSVLQEVQLEVVTEQVAQSPVQRCATPEILT